MDKLDPAISRGPSGTTASTSSTTEEEKDMKVVCRRYCNKQARHDSLLWNIRVARIPHVEHHRLQLHPQEVIVRTVYINVSERHVAHHHLTGTFD